MTTADEQVERRARDAFTMWAHRLPVGGMPRGFWESVSEDERNVWRDLIEEFGRPLMEAPKVTVNVSYLMDNGIWERACEMILGLDVRAVQEGRMGEGDEVSFTVLQARELGMLELP